MATLQIPLAGGSANAHQTFSVVLGENSIEFRLSYIQTGQWYMDLFLDDERIVSGAMLEPDCDVIRPWNIYDTVGQLVFLGDDTTLDNLGINNQLVWISPDD